MQQSGDVVSRTQEKERAPRTQEERTSATRARLVEATLDLLLSKGYPAATTQDIASRAGLTRGALAHHFASKDDLVVEAVDHLLKTTTEEIRVYASLVGAGSLSIADFVDRLWTIFSGPFFMVTLEHITAARHNEFLKARLVERTRDFHASLDGIWRHFFSESELGTLEVETTFNATLCLLRGMGVQTVLRNDPEYYRRLLRFWKSMLIEQIAASRRSPAATVKKG
jgi:AcrR family transcriptional regulator